MAGTKIVGVNSTAAIFLLAIAIAGSGAAIAAPGSRLAELEVIAEKLAVPTTQEEAILDLRNLADPAVEPLLRALKEGSLYRWRQQAAILGGDGALRDLEGQPLLDARGQPASPAPAAFTSAGWRAMGSR